MWKLRKTEISNLKDDLTKSEISKFIDFCKNDYSMQNAIKVISTPENFYRRLEKVNNRIISDNCSNDNTYGILMKLKLK